MSEIFKSRSGPKPTSLDWNLKQFFQDFCKSPQKGLKEVKKLLSRAADVDPQTGQPLHEHKIHGFIELGGAAKIKELLDQYQSKEDKEGVHRCLKLLSNNYFPFDNELIVNELKMIDFLITLQKQSWIKSDSIIVNEIDIILTRWNKIIETSFTQEVKLQRVGFYENENKQEI
ncbi:hypothetical protein RFI_21802, partial [Reticulomyxa filosa]